VLTVYDVTNRRRDRVTTFRHRNKAASLVAATFDKSDIISRIMFHQLLLLLLIKLTLNHHQIELHRDDDDL